MQLSNKVRTVVGVVHFINEPTNSRSAVSTRSYYDGRLGPPVLTRARNGVFMYPYSFVLRLRCSYTSHFFIKNHPAILIESMTAAI